MSIKDSTPEEVEWKKELRNMWADEKKRTQASKETIKEAVKEAVKETAIQPDPKDRRNSRLLERLLQVTIGIIAGAVIVTATRSLMNKDKSGFFKT